ncbi:unnamed protein product [Enterobius vermicularis]|uniref:Uncharacterized protein n=1 Tax=Enterobius vermicularis TaxID=51028 RepID=A0A0N4VE88_ENTVE|nr:unnamed protein product [Enterobius vermicularis]
MVLVADWEPSELHTFTDVFGKTRLNPARNISLPRLELSGLLFRVRPLNFVLYELRLHSSQVFLWCDSKCFLERTFSPNFSQCLLKSGPERLSYDQDKWLRICYSTREVLSLHSVMIKTMDTVARARDDFLERMNARP